MTSLLKSYKLLGYADGSISAPPPTASLKDGAADIVSPNPTYEQYCLTSILVLVNTKINLQLVEVNTVARDWSKLKILSDSRNHAHRTFSCSGGVKSLKEAIPWSIT